MKDGDRVTGVPFNSRTRKKYPTVTGKLETVKFNIMGERQTDQRVLVGDVSVDCEDGSIKPAGRRAKDTMFK